MKSLFLIGALGIFTMCTPQKQSKMSLNKPTQEDRDTLQFSKDKHLFHSEFTGGSAKRGYKILNTQEELNRALSGNRLQVLEAQKPENSLTMKYPEGQTVVLYNLGEFTSGDHQPIGIDYFQLKNKVLEVHIIRKKALPSSPKDFEMAIQVVSRPYMIFSVPKHYEFNNIIIK